MENAKQELSPTYLGITFDRGLTWKPHIEKTEKKAKTRLTIVRKLAGSNLGSRHENLKKKAFIMLEMWGQLWNMAWQRGEMLQSLI